MTVETIREHRCFGGVQGTYVHQAQSTRSAMRFALYRPPQAEGARVPVLLFLSGLTCTEENFTVKAGAQRYAAEHGLALLVPDTSPRGLGLPGETESWDFGAGASFYLDATRTPWSEHYRMESYLVDELPAVVAERFPVDAARIGISGHSMGGHGALVCALRHPARFRSVSAFSPICAPSGCPWGRKAFAGYLGDDQAAWREHDAAALIATRGFPGELLIDQGTADEFLKTQLQPERLAAACRAAKVPLTLRMQPGYDHSYFFIATFIGDHVAHHARALGAMAR
jgi:S-formylglutathione hydrolase